MEFGDEPELHLQVGSSLFSRDEVQQVLMSQSLSKVDVSFVLPWLLILDTTQTLINFWNEDMLQLISANPPKHSIISCISHTHNASIKPRLKAQTPTWTGNILTATYSVSSWAFHTHPKRPLAFNSSNWRGFRPTRGDGGAGPTLYQKWG